MTEEQTALALLARVAVALERIAAVLEKKK